MLPFSRVFLKHFKPEENLEIIRERKWDILYARFINENTKELFQFFLIVAPCIIESMYCSLTNKCTFY